MNFKTIITITALLICSSVYCQTQNSESKYVLTLGWPVNYTRIDYPQFNKDNFVITGYKSNDVEGQNCTTTKQPFNFAKIQFLDVTYLKKYVHNIDLNNHESLQELWDNAGCYEKTQTQFFADMVKAHKKYNLVKALAAKGIVPSKTRLYKLPEFKDAVQGILGGVRPRIYCRYYAMRPNEVYFTHMFDAIYLYLDEQLNVTKDSETTELTFECMPNIRYYPTDC